MKSFKQKLDEDQCGFKKEVEDCPEYALNLNLMDFTI
jgi:hypothetical protein